MKLVEKISEPLFRPKRYKVFYGGRAAAKSMQFALCAVIKAWANPTRILCAREVLKSIKGSVHQELRDAIKALQEDDKARLPEDFFDIGRDEISGKNGSLFWFEGIKNDPGKIKSLKGIDICWVEEAESVSDESWDFLCPTIRKEGSEIWVGFNTRFEDDPTFQRFVAPFITTIERQGYYEDETHYVCKVTYKDNPFISSITRKDIELDKKRNYKKYLNVWEGELLSESHEAVIQPEWFDAAIDAHKHLGFKPMGVKSLGFDPADIGDSKAVCYRHGSVIVGLDVWKVGNLEDSVTRAFQYAYDKNVDVVVYDAVGIGSGVRIGMSNRIAGRDIDVQRFVSGESPVFPTVRYKDDRTNKDTFLNIRAQKYWELHDRFENTFMAINKEGCFLPEDMISVSSEMPEGMIKLLKSELTRLHRVYKTDKIQIESKRDIKLRGLPSPNLSDAVMMSFSNKIVPKGWDRPIEYKNKMNIL